MRTLSTGALVGLSWGLTALDICLTAGRFVIIWRKSNKIRNADIFNGVALVLLLVYMITWQCYGPAEYEGQLHTAGLREGPAPQYDPIYALKLDFAHLQLYWCTVYAVKASFLALYWQIFEISRKFRISWTVVVIYTGLSFVTTVLLLLWHCGYPYTLINPRACKQWKPRAIAIMFTTAVLHIFGDILLMALPLAMLRSLRMRMREKAGLAFVFGLVLIDIAFIILRTIFSATEVYGNLPDRNTLWTVLDPIVAVTICALPCYRSLLSFGKAKPINRTPDVSFHSSNFNGSTERSLSTEVDDLVKV